jgi:hypothetical protein
MSLSFEERVANLESSMLEATSLVYLMALALKEVIEGGETPDINQSILEQQESPALPTPGYLDCEAFVKNRVGHVDMPLTNRFGQACARAAREQGIEPIKMTSPGEHWDSVNTWPIQFLREIWFLTFGGV